MRIIEIAQLADLTDESSMADVIELIAQRELSSGQALYLSCVDREDPSQLYDALIHFGAKPLEWAE